MVGARLTIRLAAMTMKTKLVIASLSAVCVLSPCGAISQASTLANGSFETPVISTAAPLGYVYPAGPSGGWTFSTPFVGTNQFDGSGIINGTTGTAWWSGGLQAAPTGYDGNQFAFVQGLGAFSQTFVAPFTGQFSVNWLEGSRQNERLVNAQSTFDGAQSYNVLLNNVVLGTYSTPSGQNFEAESTSLFSLIGGVSYTLEFEGLTSVGDHTAFIDMVSVDGTAAATPLPAALPLFATGIGAIGLLGWRRKRKARAA